MLHDAIHSEDAAAATTHERGATDGRSHRLRGEPDDEAGAAAGTVLDPRFAADRGGVLGDEREPEPGAHPMARRAPAGEPLEDAGPLAGGDTRAVVLDHEQHRLLRRRRFDRDPGRAVTVVRRIVEQVAEDPLEPEAVDEWPAAWRGDGSRSGRSA